MTVAPPNTVAQLSHAVTMRVNGITIGAINEWNPRMNKTVTELYEFGPGTTGPYASDHGEPFEKVPGNVSGMQVEVRRYDIYTQQMEQAFGTPDITMLSSQKTAFEVREAWNVIAGVQSYANVYRGCWFSDLGRTLTATGDRTVNVSATLQYTHKDRIPI